jgi:small subunit ribosomal protein S15
MRDCCINLEKLEIESIMALTQQRKQEIISNYQVHETDTGSSDVQIAMLTERINRLSEHLQANKKDHSSRRGLLKLIGHRKRLLSYVQQESREKYQALIARLGIRG